MPQNTDKKLELLWDTIIQKQVQFGLPFELMIYYTLDIWHSSKSVLDLGTGSGLYLLELAKLFPEKCYLGIDSHTGLINKARNIAIDDKYKQLDVKFEECDIYQTTGQYDFVISRLLLQHINTYQDFFSHMSNIIAPSGELLVIESDDDGREYYPELPLMRGFIKKLQTIQKKSGGNRFALNDLDSFANSSGFELVERNNISIPSTIPGFKSIFFDVFSAAFEMVKLQYKLDYDYDALNKEWVDWFNSPSSYTHGSLAFARYKRKYRS